MGASLLHNGISIMMRPWFYIDTFPGAFSNIKTAFDKYRDSQYKDRTGLRPPSLNNGNIYTRKDGLYIWKRAIGLYWSAACGSNNVSVSGFQLYNEAKWEFIWSLEGFCDIWERMGLLMQTLQWSYKPYSAKHSHQSNTWMPVQLKNCFMDIIK